MITHVIAHLYSRASCEMFCMSPLHARGCLLTQRTLHLHLHVCLFIILVCNQAGRRWFDISGLKFKDSHKEAQRPLSTGMWKHRLFIIGWFSFYKIQLLIKHFKCIFLKSINRLFFPFLIQHIFLLFRHSFASNVNGRSVSMYDWALNVV